MHIKTALGGIIIVLLFIIIYLTSTCPCGCGCQGFMCSITKKCCDTTGCHGLDITYAPETIPPGVIEQKVYLKQETVLFEPQWPWRTPATTGMKVLHIDQTATYNPDGDLMSPADAAEKATSATEHFNGPQRRINNDRRVTLHYAPWCHFCKDFMPIYHNLRATLAANGSQIILDENNEDEKKTPGITQYPTLMMLDEYGVRTQYRGQMTFDHVRQWIMAPVHAESFRTGPRYGLGTEKFRTGPRYGLGTEKFHTKPKVLGADTRMNVNTVHDNVNNARVATTPQKKESFFGWFEKRADANTIAKRQLLLYELKTCPACVAIKPQWESLKQTLGGKLAMREVDGGVSPADDIHQYPTLVLVDEDGKRRIYSGPADAKTVTDFVSKA